MPDSNAHIPDVSVIIISFNTQRLLEECLRSVIGETSGLEYEVIVVDNASSDDSVAMVAKEFPGVHVIVNTRNRGFAAANNQAVGIARGRVLLLLNSDTRILDGAIQKIVRFMENKKDAAIVGCKLLNADGTLQPSCMGFPTVWNLFSESFFLYILFKKTAIFGSYYMTNFSYDIEAKVDFVKGAFMMIRREVVDTIGLFDESYFMYTEESDFCFRAKEQNFLTYFVPHAEIIHYGGASMESTDRFFDQLHSTQLYFIRKNFKGIRRFFGVALKQVGIVLRVPVYLLAGLLTFDAALLKKSRSYSAVFLKSLR